MVLQTRIIVGQLYGVPHGILRVFQTIGYENEFQKGFSREFYFSTITA
jgi:hypothetical protein